MPGRSLRAVMAALVAVLALTLGGCREDPPADPLDHVEVAGAVGQRPVVQVDTPLKITEVETEELVTGEGRELTEDNAVMLAFLAVDAITGDVVEDSYGGEPRILLLTEDEAGPLYHELLGRTEGSRLLRLEPGSMTRPDPVVIVYDVLYTQAHGTELETPAGVGHDDLPFGEVVDEQLDEHAPS